jgi:hypothetical protein
MQTLASHLSCKLSLLNSHQLSCKLSLLDSHQLSCKLSLLNSRQLSCKLSLLISHANSRFSTLINSHANSRFSTLINSHANSHFSTLINSHANSRFSTLIISHSRLTSAWNISSSKLNFTILDHYLLAKFSSQIKSLFISGVFKKKLVDGHSFTRVRRNINTSSAILFRKLKFHLYWDWRNNENVGEYGEENCEYGDDIVTTRGNWKQNTGAIVWKRCLPFTIYLALAWPFNENSSFSLSVW